MVWKFGPVTTGIYWQQWSFSAKATKSSAPLACLNQVKACPFGYETDSRGEYVQDEVNNKPCKCRDPSQNGENEVLYGDISMGKYEGPFIYKYFYCMIQ